MFTGNKVREAFLNFFQKSGHQRIHASSLIPANDPTLLFTNAGMVQFKDVFLGSDDRLYKRATSSQKCLRVSGKHNDLESVGPSLRHHTFFEMMGNFSFGDYFKEEAIRFHYDLITKVFGLPEDRLVFTVFKDDTEAYEIWRDLIKVDPNRIVLLGHDTNFWRMGDTGPCGPTSEVLWDKFPTGSTTEIQSLVEADDDRFLEMCNLVFMQFNRRQPDPNESGKYDEALPQKGIDTGMGLERMTSILQGVNSNYETDLFWPIIEETQKYVGYSNKKRDENIIPFRVIADHIRAATFLVGDGVLPGGKGRESICRLVIRRAARFGRKIGLSKPFLGNLVNTVIEIMGEHYKELLPKQPYIQNVINSEEEKFLLVLDKGISALQAEILSMKQEKEGSLSGKKAFYFKATHGLPKQIIIDELKESGLDLNHDEFLEEELAHSKISGGGMPIGEMNIAKHYLLAKKDLDEKKVKSIYNPYTEKLFSAKIVKIIRGKNEVTKLTSGETGEVILDLTHFYVEAGGQVSDRGDLIAKSGLFKVHKMSQPINGLVLHMGCVERGEVNVGDEIKGKINLERRKAISQNHTATHLLHAALKKVLGNFVNQNGSLVAPERLRFDFSYNKKISERDLKEIQNKVNHIIHSHLPVIISEMDYAIAIQEGATALFGEKYTNNVRTVNIHDKKDAFRSYELCGGTHVENTSDIIYFKIIKEGSVSAGTRRIEAITGQKVIEHFVERDNILNDLSSKLGTKPQKLENKIDRLSEELGSIKVELEKLRTEKLKNLADKIKSNYFNFNKVKVLVEQIDNLQPKQLRKLAGDLSSTPSQSLVVLFGANNSRVSIVVAVPELLIHTLSANTIVKRLTQIIGGGGGGGARMALAGGKVIIQIEKIKPAILKIVQEELA